MKTSHNLDFEVAPWKTKEWLMFKVGTCNGLWRCNCNSYEILAISNDIPGNGHFEDVLEWFEFSCKRDKKDLVFLEIWNEKLMSHLINKRGFVGDGDCVLVRKKYN